jgi:hypothetical protein
MFSCDVPHDYDAGRGQRHPADTLDLTAILRATGQVAMMLRIGAVTLSSRRKNWKPKRMDADEAGRSPLPLPLRDA